MKIIAKNNTAFIYARLRLQCSPPPPLHHSLACHGCSQDLMKGGCSRRRSFMAIVFVEGLALHTGMLLKDALQNTLSLPLVDAPGQEMLRTVRSLLATWQRVFMISLGIFHRQFSKCAKTHKNVEAIFPSFFPPPPAVVGVASLCFARLQFATNCHKLILVSF